MQIKNFFILIYFVGLTSHLIAQGMEDVKISVVRVTDNIYMLKGRGGNIGVITGDNGTLIVDDQFGELTEKIKQAIKTITDNPVKFVVNTHLHGDHLGGNENFANGGSIIIAHENVRKRISTEQFNKLMNTSTPPLAKAAWPVITFNTDIQFYIGDEVVHVIKTSNAHTDGDGIIYFKKANVVHTGDTFVTYGFPYIDVPSGGTFLGLIQASEILLKNIDGQTKIIPGHGEVCSKKDVELFINRLKEIRDIVKSGIKAGKDASKLINENVLSKFEKEWGNGFIKAKDFISTIYPELKGE